MVSEAPPFWWKKGDPRAWLLAPASLVYGYFASRRMRNARRAEVDVPVICVGNFTVGGAGKTPTVITLARAAKARGLTPGVLSRGYGGSMDRTTVVDPGHHRARDVGDEPLLIAREALTVISRRRLEGARMLIEQGADLIIMDDGFQSAALRFDYALMVVDSHRGIGNGFLVPAGPVRAPTTLQLAHSTALLKLGDGDGADPFIRIAARSGKPVYEGTVRPVGDAAAIAGKPVLAFAGIADPKKFFRTVRSLGAEIVAKRAFGDHQHLSDDEIADILSTAERKELTIVTTAKDAVRLRGHHGRAEELAGRIVVIEVEMAFDSPTTPRLILDSALQSFRKRRLAAKAG